MARILSVALVLAATCGTSLATAAPAAAADPIIGSGSTGAEVALEQWSADVYSLENLRVDYNGIGSRGGRQQFAAGAVDFAGTGLPFAPEELAAGVRPFAYVPVVASGIAIGYNLVDAGGQRLTTLRLTPNTLCRLFTGAIASWGAPALVALNPSLAGPTLPVTTLVPYAEEGGVAVLADFCRTEVPAVWEAFVPGGGSVATGRRVRHARSAPAAPASVPRSWPLRAAPVPSRSWRPRTPFRWASRWRPS